MNLPGIKCWLLALFSGVSFFTARSQVSRIDNWNQDISYLETELPKRHINLYSVKSKEVFQAELQELREGLPRMPDVDIALRLQQIISGFGDSHTSIQWWAYTDSTGKMPLQLYWFHDGIFILQTSEEYKQALEKKIISINNFPINDIVDSLKTLITVDNRASVKNNIPKMIPSWDVLKYFHICNGATANFSLADTSDNIMQLTISRAEIVKSLVKVPTDTIPFHLQHSQKLFTEKYFPEDSVYFIIYNQCWSRELEQLFRKGSAADSLPSFTEFQKTVIENIEQNPIRKLIFDMRFNSGGSSLQGTKLISRLSEIKKLRGEKIIYVLIGRRTFSSAILNVLDFRQMTKAVLVGEATEGKPNHYGEIRSIHLPKSGLMVSYSTKFFERNLGYTDTIEPDVLIEKSFSDYRRGIDPVFEWVRKQP